MSSRVPLEAVNLLLLGSLGSYQSQQVQPVTSGSLVLLRLRVHLQVPTSPSWLRNTDSPRKRPELSVPVAFRWTSSL